MNEVIAPLLTVGLITRNAARYVRVALESLERQGFQDFELLVVDGMSEDNTLAIIEQFSKSMTIRVICEPDDGSNDAFGKAVANAQGRYFLLLCADDWLEPGSLVDVGPLLRSGVDAVTMANHFWRDGVGIFRTIKGDETRLTLANILAGRMLTNARIVRTSLLKAILPVRHRIPSSNGRLTLAADLDVWLRLLPSVRRQAVSAGGGIINRWHDGSLTFNDRWASQRQLALDSLWFIVDFWKSASNVTIAQHGLLVYWIARRCAGLGKTWVRCSVATHVDHRKSRSL